MKLRELLSSLPKEAIDWDVIFSSDEELNCLRTKGEFAIFTDKPNTLVIYGFDGSELEEE